MHTPLKTSYNLDRFKIKGSIGKGSYAEIYEATDLVNNKSVVLKQLNQQDFIKKGKEYEVHMERYILKTYSKKHQGLIQLYGIFKTNDSIYIVLEHCPYGDLGNLFQNSQMFQFEEWDHIIREYMYQLSLILNFLHSQGISHLDVKPQNLVIDKNKNLKLIDFGTAQFTDKALSSESNNKPDFDRIRQLTNHKLSSFVGTPQYISPEMIQYSQAHEEADIWALGCILYEAYYDIQPFNDDMENQIYENILNLKFQTQQPKFVVPSDAQDLISKLLVLDCKNRLGAQNPQDLLNHPFFDSVRLNDHWNKPFNTITDFSFLLIQADQSRDPSIFEPEIHNIAPKISDATTKLKLSMGDLKDIVQIYPQKQLNTPQKLSKTCTMILMKSKWFCLPKPLLLVIDIESKMFKILDFKKILHVVQIDEKTIIQKFGKKDVKIFQKGKSGFDLEFRVVDIHFNWDYIIESLKLPK